MFMVMNKSYETYNLIHPEQTSTGDLARLLQKKYDFKIFFNTVQKEGADMPYMSPKKAMEDLGWKPIPLEEAIDKTVQEMFSEAKNVEAAKPETSEQGKDEDTLQWLQRKLKNS
jgi:nucleoside-diphosphate-sugar epimerase